MSFLGKDGFTWWIGVVENRMDPLMLGRCQVRILGWHTKDKSVLPTDGLPWAMPIQPITSAAQTGVGTSPTGPVEGTWVFGFYRDGNDGQEPMMLGTMGGIPDEGAKQNLGFNDPRLDIDPAPFIHGDGNKLKQEEKKLLNVPRDPDYDASTYTKGQRVVLQNRGSQGSNTTISTYPDSRYLNEPTTPRNARGTENSAATRILESGQAKPEDGPIYGRQLSLLTNIPRLSTTNKRFNEPDLPFSAKYPYNHVHQSESGHLVEIDDTPKHERMHWFHRSGSYIEMQSDGNLVLKSVGDKYDLALHNNFEAVQNQKVSTISGGFELFVNESTTSDNNFHLRVGKGSDALIETDEGNIVIGSKGTDTINFNARNISTNFTGDLTTTSNQDMTVSARNFTQSIGGNTSFTSDGTLDLAGSPITLSSAGNFVSITSQNMSQDVAETSVELLQSTPPAIPVTYAKEINSNTGKIKLESRDVSVTGGIELNLGLSGDLLSTLAGQITVESSPTKPGTIKLNSLLGDVVISASVGDFETTVLKGDYKLTTGAGDITQTATAGNIELDAVVGEVEISGKTKATIKSTTEVVNEATTITLKGTTNLGQASAAEPLILGKKFIDEFITHIHATGTGPTGPVENAGIYTQTLSQKVFGS